MTRILENVKIPIPPEVTALTLDQQIEEHLSWLAPSHGPYRILRQSVDARTRHSPHFVMSFEVADAQEQLPQKNFPVQKLFTKAPTAGRPIVIGTGPAGLFAALRLAERGLAPIIFERGSESTERIKGINRFWRYGELDPRNNVCFGEGGAGLYSDGKLITRIKSPYIPYVMNRLVQFGAPAEIEYLSNPHVGSDRIRRVIPTLREHLKKLGCEIHYNTQITEILVHESSTKKHIRGVRTEHGKIYESDFVILATGHSAEDMLEHLRDIGVFLEAKPFAMGLRVEHPQHVINKIQWRELAGHPWLGSANYRLAHHDEASQIGVYSFCMCPGGFVLSSGTEADRTVCNGMSNYRRNSPYANAALVITIPNQESAVWAGMDLRKSLENKAYLAAVQAGSAKALPTQNLMGFMEGQDRPLLPGSSPSGAVPVRWDQLLPKNLQQRLQEGILQFEKNMKGFLSAEAQLYGVESRTSCPVRITRDAETLQSISHAGLFPAGEGAGYAGGITSAACDGIRLAEKICELVRSQHPIAGPFEC